MILMYWLICQELGQCFCAREDTKTGNATPTCNQLLKANLSSYSPTHVNDFDDIYNLKKRQFESKF